VLTRKAAVGLGLISYPFYLWHWPLLSFAYIIYGGKPTFQERTALVFAAFVLAFLTYRFLELPIRAIRSNVKVISALTFSMVLMAILGVLANTGTIRERIETNGADIYLNALNDHDFPGPTFVPFRYQGMLFQKVPSQAPGLTVFLGDSLVQQYGPYIEQAIASQPAKFHSVIFATANGCVPILHTVRLPLTQFPLCRKATEAAYDLANKPEVDTVVIGASWYVYFRDSSLDLWFENGSVRQAFPGADATENAFEEHNLTEDEQKARVFDPTAANGP
jgi:hypothetical protein